MSVKDFFEKKVLLKSRELWSKACQNGLKSLSAKFKTCQRFFIFVLRENVWIMQSWNHHEKVNHVGERQIFEMRKFLTYFGDDVKDMPQLKLNPDMLKYTPVLQNQI